MTGPISNVVGVDDAPFVREHRGDVALIGAVCSRTRLDGVLRSKVRRDGANSTTAIVDMLRRSHFAEHVQAILLQGIAVAGFNVIDIHTLARKSGVPVLVVARHQPDMKALHHALSRGSGAERKWRLIERAGPMEPMRGVFVQRAGLSSAHAEHLLAATTLHGKLPEAIRLAHLVAGGITTGTSRGRA